MKISLILKIAIGFLALSLGAIGLILPVWPTTPFVLLAVGCFSSVPRIQKRILKIRFFREYYEGYIFGRGLRRKTVTVSLVFLWGMLILSAFLSGKVSVALLLFLVGVAVTIHILWIARTKKDI